ncbi:hypothetical protein A3Q56_03034 [Intoshia linei]|uniref:Fork-head domain-containing protein n=1 Tax=Intoshia linei TaxID=1819745 RepID=A0A177B6M4_9BILA|nr:hypothetical protein A3Q56_03034 [Intoshia linei]
MNQPDNFDDKKKKSVSEQDKSDLEAYEKRLDFSTTKKYLSSSYTVSYLTNNSIKNPMYSQMPYQMPNYQQMINYSYPQAYQNMISKYHYNQAMYNSFYALPYQSHLTLSDPKPPHSYIGLISMAILLADDKKLVLSEIYDWIQSKYAYFRNRGPGWRNSIRHNLSLNECFVKSTRSANGKGHYWSIHDANESDFMKGDFRRRHAQRKVRQYMGIEDVDDEDDCESPPPLNYATLDTVTQNFLMKCSSILADKASNKCENEQNSLENLEKLSTQELSISKKLSTSKELSTSINLSTSKESIIKDVESKNTDDVENKDLPKSECSESPHNKTENSNRNITSDLSTTSIKSSNSSKRKTPLNYEKLNVKKSKNCSNFGIEFILGL